MQGASPGVLAGRALSKRFGSREALRGVDVELSRGEVLGVIGPNGAGKTTLLSLLSSTAAPSGGSVAASGRIGWVPQRLAVYSKLSVAENLRLFARLERIPEPERAVEQMLEMTALAERAGDELGSLSGGNRQRVNIAVGLLGEPVALLLDEPSAALDPRQRARLWRFLEDLARDGTSVMFATHDVSEVERHAQRVLVLADGELLFDGVPEELKEGRETDLERAFVSFLRDRGH